MILALGACVLLAWLLARIARTRTGDSVTNLRRMAATFATASFLTLVFALGFAAQPFVDFYVGGSLDEFVSDLQNLVATEIMMYAGNAFLLGLIPALPATITLDRSRSFLAGVAWATLACVLALAAQFLISFWGAPYRGSVGLALFSAIVGAALACFFAQALRCEILDAAPIADRKDQRAFIAKIGGGAAILSVILSFAFYYLLVFPLLKPVDLRFRDWRYLMLSNASAEHVVSVGLVDEVYSYRPSIPFQGAHLEEQTLVDPATGRYAAPPSLIRLHAAHIRDPSFTLTTENFRYGRHDRPAPSYMRSSLAILRFANCTARDLTELGSRFPARADPAQVIMDGAGFLELRAHSAWVFNPRASASGLNLMMPAWDDDWIHVAPLEGRGASIGAQTPLTGPARAMILSGEPVRLAVAVNPSALDRAHIIFSQGGRFRRAPMGGVHDCRRRDHGPVDGVRWDAIPTDDRTPLAGFLVDLGMPSLQAGNDRTGGQYVVRLENPEAPTTLRERLVVPLANGPALNSLLSGTRAGVIGLSMDGGAGHFVGAFGALVFPEQDYSSSTISGDELRLEDDPTRLGGLRLRGNARHVIVDGRHHYYTFGTQISETVAWTAMAAAFSALAAALLFLWRRLPRYGAALACMRVEGRGADPEPATASSSDPT
jgi:hypothetical protein